MATTTAAPTTMTFAAPLKLPSDKLVILPNQISDALYYTKSMAHCLNYDGYAINSAASELIIELPAQPSMAECIKEIQGSAPWDLSINGLSKLVMPNVELNDVYESDANCCRLWRTPDFDPSLSVIGAATGTESCIVNTIGYIEETAAPFDSNWQYYQSIKRIGTTVDVPDYKTQFLTNMIYAPAIASGIAREIIEPASGCQLFQDVQVDGCNDFDVCMLTATDANFQTCADVGITNIDQCLAAGAYQLKNNFVFETESFTDMASISWRETDQYCSIQTYTSNPTCSASASGDAVCVFGNKINSLQIDLADTCNSPAVGTYKLPVGNEAFASVARVIQDTLQIPFALPGIPAGVNLFQLVDQKQAFKVDALLNLGFLCPFDIFGFFC